MKRKLIIAMALALATALPAQAAGPALETEDQKTIYAIGLSIAQSLQSLSLTKAEEEIVKMGLSDGLVEGKAQIDIKEYRPKIQALAQARAQAAAEVEKKAGAEFLEKMAKEKGAEKTASGLIFIPVKAGSGASPKATDTVKVHYHGTLRDGSVFDSSVERGQPATFPLNRVIPCWTEGVAKMKVGEKAKLVCPSAIGYGDRGSPPKIKPGAALVFEVELLGIETPAAPPAPPAAAPAVKPATAPPAAPPAAKPATKPAAPAAPKK
jgi:FKBP-type peptidyl-prolyl cis-trans isomerase FkpA/FKBP-type peptidyl-prolyl cis-trans isomerase FklB